MIEVGRPIGDQVIILLDPRVENGEVLMRATASQSHDHVHLVVFEHLSPTTAASMAALESAVQHLASRSPDAVVRIYPDWENRDGWADHLEGDGTIIAIFTTDSTVVDLAAPSIGPDGPRIVVVGRDP